MQPVLDIAGLWTATGPASGPHVAVTGLVHGDEPCGRVAIERLLAIGCAPARGRLSLALVNLDAVRECRRYLERDMNQLWRDEGRHLIDYGRFSDPADPATALTLECGRHDEPAAGETAFRAAVRFVEVSGADAVVLSPRPAPGPGEIAFYWCRPAAGEGGLDA